MYFDLVSYDTYHNYESAMVDALYMLTILQVKRDYQPNHLQLFYEAEYQTFGPLDHNINVPCDLCQANG